MKDLTPRNWFARTFLPPQSANPQAMEIQAEQDGAEAQNNLGVLFTNCPPFPSDLEAAVRNFQKSADRGNPLAQVNLGLMHARGEGVALNTNEARKWFRRAAEQGDASGQFKLGMSCHRGSFDLTGAPAEEAQVEALKWFLLAAAQQFQNAENLSGSLTMQMTSAQVAETNRRVAAFAKKIEGSSSLA